MSVALPTSARSPSVWTTVLAGGAGTRLSSATAGVPKQFWRSRSGFTLLEDTLRRLRPIAPPERTVVVACTAHRSYLDVSASELLRDVRVAWQPHDRGTAAGVVLGLLPIMDQRPDACVVISPSDHGIHDEVAFHDGLAVAIDHVDRSDDIVLCSVEATCPAGDYGWIVPGPRRGGTQVRSIVSFREKPEASGAMALYQHGALWNTMVIVARARVLFALVRKWLPELAAVFVQAMRLPADARGPWLEAAYDALEPVDFSRDLLSVASGLRTIVWPSTMGWSDLGTPERLSQWESALL